MNFSRISGKIKLTQSKKPGKFHIYRLDVSRGNNSGQKLGKDEIL